MSKNLVWIVLDSVRADRTSLGGHDRDTTPTLTAIGERDDGVAGTCFAHGIWSQPSVASMLTGTYPSTHGSGSHNEALPRSIPTVAERLSRAGYHTVGVSANPYFSSTTGADRGFEQFEFLSGGALASAAGPLGLLSFVRYVRRFSGGFTLDRRKHSPDFLLNEVVTDHLGRCVARDEPFFLAAHYAGAHHPYTPSPAFRNRFVDELPFTARQAATVSFARTTDVYAEIARGGLDAPTREAIRAMYDALVFQSDALVGRLLSTIDRLGISDETVVVITSDHGDLLGELGLLSHKLLLHDGLIEVPIAVRGSHALAGRTLGLAQHADVLQTLLAELGVDTAGMDGRRLDEGAPDVAVAQRGGETCQKTMNEIHKHDPSFEHGHVVPGFVTAYRTDEWKLVAGERDALLYELPDEGTDVSGRSPDTAAHLGEQLTAWLAERDTVRTTASAEFDDRVREQLADLGYVVE